MRLLRLLSAGRCLIGIESFERAYRFTPAGMLPKFGTGKNPFQGRKAAPVEKAPPPAETEAASALAAPGPDSNGPAKPTTAVASGPGGPPSRSGLGTNVSALVAKIASRFRRSKPGNVFVQPAKTRPEPVQGELLLDRVQVVRNDLSDADVEVVAAKSSPAVVAGAGAGITPDRAFAEVPPTDREKAPLPGMETT